ncbi:MAG: LamG domain-containing protein [Candidatus Altiarchaeota archaeon]|nr:LamG domain-containing protein [Candidatus Altiarchaeota archaeon]
MKFYVFMIGIILLISSVSAYLPGTLEDGLLSYWRMENDSSDYMGAHNGTTQGGPTYTTDGIVGGAYEFDGIDDYIDISDSAATFNAMSGGSISAWFRFNSPFLDDFRPILYIGTDYPGKSDGMIVEVGHPQLDPRTNVYLTMTPAANTNPIWCYDFDQNLSTGQWYHFVGVVNSSGNMGYLNGVEVTDRDYNFGDSSSTEFFDDVTDADLFTLGYGMFATDYTFYYFNGTIDEVGIWNRSLSSDEVSELYSWATVTTTTTSTSTTSTTSTSTTSTTSTSTTSTSTTSTTSTSTSTTSTTSTSTTTTTSTSTTSLPPTTRPFVSRELPGSAQANSTVNVTLRLTLPSFGAGNIPDFITVEETLPSNWSILTVNPSGTVVQNTIQWDLQLEVDYFPGLTSNFVYTTGIPESIEGSFDFTGQFSCNYSNGTRTAEDTGGNLQMGVLIPCELLGDEQPCDGTVSDFEVLAYITLWSQGEVSDFDLLYVIGAWSGG